MYVHKVCVCENISVCIYLDVGTKVCIICMFICIWRYIFIYSPKESSLKNSSSGSYCFVAILLVLFGNFETPTTCAFIVVGGWWWWWWWWWWGVFCSMLCPLGNKGFCQVSYGYSKPRIFSSLWLLTNCKFGCRLNFSDIP